MTTFANPQAYVALVIRVLSEEVLVKQILVLL